ncbi:MAG: hypothetical protein DRN30_00065 [Thermoplasmata archaeon]|nr:MAG: hypothetical protein DRN30_00065 [Thermoplasmata archaeon]
MTLQTVRAIYKDKQLIFADRNLVPENGAEVVITFINTLGPEIMLEADPIRELRGRGKGEKLVERLLQSRREDQKPLPG